MNNLISELIDIAKLPFNEVSSDFKIIMLSNKVLHISNFTKLLDYTNQKIVIKVNKKQNVIINGEDLKICQINKKELAIKGKILTCVLGDINEKKWYWLLLQNKCRRA